MHSADEPEWIVLAAPESDNMRAALTWAIETKRTERSCAFFAPGSRIGFSELGRLVLAAAPRRPRVPGIAEDRRLPIVLAPPMHAVVAG